MEDMLACIYPLWLGERKDEFNGSNHKCLCLCAYADMHLTLANSYRLDTSLSFLILCHKRPQRDEEGGLCSFLFLSYRPRNLGTSSSQVLCQRSPRRWIGLWPLNPGLSQYPLGNITADVGSLQTRNWRKTTPSYHEGSMTGLSGILHISLSHHTPVPKGLRRK